MQPHDVFISYSNTERSIANKICQYLEDSDIRCWIAPRDIPGGCDYSDAIVDAIKGCKVFLLFFSHNASVSQWINGEVTIAFNEKKFIIPYKIDATKLEGGLLLKLNQFQCIDSSSNPLEKVTSLRDSILHVIGTSENTIFPKQKTEVHLTKSQRDVKTIGRGIAPFFKSTASCTSDQKNRQNKTDRSQKEISKFYVINNDCVACGTCIDECPVGAISEGAMYTIDPELCIACGTCAAVCPSGAISL